MRVDALIKQRKRGPNIAPVMVIDAFSAGAKGIFCREDSLTSLPERYPSGASCQIRANSTPLVVEANDKAPLSKRDQEVAERVSAGLSHRKIAQRLKLREHTVKNYLFHIFENLGNDHAN